MGEHDYSAAIAKIKVPMLILDQKWHRLFALGGKPSNVKELETRENDLLKREAELKKELKDLKKVKENLMSSVMSNMEGTSDLVSKKLDDDKRLLEECLQRMSLWIFLIRQRRSISSLCLHPWIIAMISFALILKRLRRLPTG